MARSKAGAAEFRAILRYAPFTARKAKQMVDLIRGKSVNQALEELRYVNRRAAPALYKLLESAVANAGQTGGVQGKDLIVASCCANEGSLKQRRKRFRPGPRGRAMPILKRTSHLEVILSVATEKAGKRPRVARTGKQPAADATKGA